jgi:hypothetical protein
MGCLSYVQYGSSLFSFIYVLSFSLFVRGLSLLLTFYMYCLSLYSYGGYLSYLLSICTVFLSIRTGAIPPTHFLYVLSFSLFVRGLSLLLTFYMYCLSLYSYGGYSSYLFSTWAVHSVYVATVEFILEYILEMKTLT